MKTNYKPITTKDIEDMHPKNVLSESDVYFAHLARKILSELSRNKLIDADFSGCLRDISLKLTAYFEDLISGLGLFAGLRKMHGQMFGKKLPFFTLGNDYLDDEINIEDLQFLIWIIMQKPANEIDNFRLLNVEKSEIVTVASTVMNILEKEYETAPENEKLHNMLHEHVYSDFSEFRSILEWLYYGSYLSTTHPNLALLDEVKKLLKRFDDYHIPLVKEKFMSSWKLNRIFEPGCTPLTVKATDWWKAITGNSEILNILDKVEYRKTAYYKIKNLKDAAVKVSPLLNDMEMLDMDCNSFRGRTDGKGKKTIYTTLVKFKDLWQANGFMLFVDNESEILKGLKEKAEKEELDRQNILFTYEQMMDCTGNRPLLFFKTFDKWIDFWKQSFPYVRNIEEIHTDEMKAEKNLAVFVNQTSGVTAVPDAAPLIKAPDNKLYDRKVAEEQGIALLCGAIQTPLEMLEYVIENNMLPNVKLNSPKGEAHGRQLVQDNMRFIVRFFQPELFNNS